MDFHISGRILRSNQPMNLYVENVFMDFYGMMGGIYMNADCNYPEASLTGSVFLTNVTAFNSQNRVTDFKSGILYYSGPANVTIQNTKILIFGSLIDGRNQVEIHLNDACIPNDSIIQTITIQNNYVSLESNPNNDRFIELFIDVTDNYKRELKVNFLDNQITNILNNIYPTIY